MTGTPRRLLKWRQKALQKDALGYRLQAGTLMAGGEYRQAESCLRQAVKLAGRSYPERSLCRRQLGRCLQALGNNKDAARVLFPASDTAAAVLRRMLYGHPRNRVR